MKRIIPVYLLLLVMLLSIGPVLAQSRGRVISKNQILILDPISGTFQLQRNSDPEAAVGDSVEVTTEQTRVSTTSLGIASTTVNTRPLTTSLRSGSGVGEILSMKGTRSQSGQIMYKNGDNFTLINYKNQRVASHLGIGSCVSFTIKRGNAVGFEEAECDQ